MEVFVYVYVTFFFKEVRGGVFGCYLVIYFWLYFNIP